MNCLFLSQRNCPHDNILNVSVIQQWQLSLPSMRILTSSLFAESYLLYWTAFVLYLQAFWNKRETGSLIKQRTVESKKKDTPHKTLEDADE